MKLPTTLTGKSDPGYVGIRSELYYAASKANGEMNVDGASYPKLSNGQVVALVQAWRRASARSVRPSWPISFDLLIAALGWRKPGDRFVMSREHASALASGELVALFWLATGDLAESLDGARTKRLPLIVDYSYAGYEAAAREAWREMQASSGMPPLPDKIPPSPIAPVLPPKIPRMGGGGILLLLLLIAAHATTRKKN